MFQSIKARLFIFIFVSISALLIGSGFFVYNEVKSMLVASVDEGLHSDIQIFTGLLNENKGKIEFELSEVVSGDYAIPRSGHYYKIMSSGKVIASSPSLVDPGFEFIANNDSSSLTDHNHDAFTSIGPAGELVRVMKQDIRIFDSAVTLIAARSIAESRAMMHRFRIFLIIAILASMSIIALSGLIIAQHGLKPLRDFVSKVKNISHKTLGMRIKKEEQSSELRELTQSFNAMLDRLQRSFEAEKRIVSDASHELKTPIAVIRSRCDVLLQKSRTAAEYVDGLHSIRSVLIRMGEVIKDMLALAQLDSGSLESAGFSKVNIVDCIKNAAELAQPIAEKKNINLVIKTEKYLWVNAQRDRLTEAFLNIIGNSIQYNQDSGSVIISASHSDSNAIVRVKDTGMGINTDEKERIFDRFYRGGSSRNLEGTGLGLSISKSVIDAHDGSVTVESEYGKGSEFIITLPLIAD
jgi:heavy metal sensor kinase